MSLNNLFRKIEEYAFEPQPLELQNANVNPFLSLMHDHPVAFLSFMQIEIKLATLYNIVFFFFLVLIVPSQIEVYFECSIIATLNLLLICFINTLVLPSKYLILNKLKKIKSTINIEALGPMNLRVFNFFYSRILNVNSAISKVLMLAYVSCFYTFIGNIDKRNPTCNEGIGLYYVGLILTLAFGLKMFLTYWRFKKFYFKQYLGNGEISKSELKKTKILKIKDESSLLMYKEKEEKCVICWEDYKIDDQIRCLHCDGKHFFHQDCVDQWLKSYSRCPICNKSFFSDDE